MTDIQSEPSRSKPCVFIHTNHKQILGAIVGAHSVRRQSRHNEKFDVCLIEHKDHAFLHEKEGQPFLRDGVERIWRNEDLQSFTPLRFMPPELMGYQGRAVVTDPDVFAVGDVWDLLSRDMQGKAIFCRPRDRRSRSVKGRMATSVMLLDCAKLEHWRVEEQFESLFRKQLDYKDWITLVHEPRESLGLFESGWNDLDALDPAVEDGPAGRFHTRRQVPEIPAPGLAALGTPQAARRPRASRTLPTAPGRESGGLFLRPAARMCRCGPRECRVHRGADRSSAREIGCLPGHGAGAGDGLDPLGPAGGELSRATGGSQPMSIQQDLARQHVRAMVDEAREADIPVDVIGRAALAQIIEIWKETRSEEDIASELRFTSESLGSDVDFEFMRP
jgi:hypothetical protein